MQGFDDEQSEARRADDLVRRYIESKTGWSRFCIQLHDLSPRWQYWAIVLMTKRLPPPSVLAYPRIDFADHLTADSPAARMIQRCLAPFRADERAFDDLLDWMLFGFGDPEVTVLSAGNAPRYQHFEEVFALAPLIEHPGDWIGHLYEMEIASKSTKDATGFFSTPPVICKAMVAMAMHDVAMHAEPLLASVNEPCCGTGRMLLEASNHSINLSGQDVNRTLVRITKVNGWLYMPSLVMPCPQLVALAPIALREVSAPTERASSTNATASSGSSHSIEPATTKREERMATSWTATTLFPDS